jgi:hypothetical protein
MKLHDVILQCDVCILCRMKSARNWSGIFPFLSSGQIVRWAVAVIKGMVEICDVSGEPMQYIHAKSSIQ